MSHYIRCPYCNEDSLDVDTLSCGCAEETAAEEKRATEQRTNFDRIAALEAQLAEVTAERDHLQRGRCAYCNWGDDADHTVEELQAHIEVCAYHPIPTLKKHIATLTAERDALRADLTKRTAALEVIVDAVKSLLLANGKLNIWCMATHGHIPFGWAEYMNALTCLRVALAAMEVPHDKPRD